VQKGWLESYEKFIHDCHVILLLHGKKGDGNVSVCVPFNLTSSHLTRQLRPAEEWEGAGGKRESERKILSRRLLRSIVIINIGIFKKAEGNCSPMGTRSFFVFRPRTCASIGFPLFCHYTHAHDASNISLSFQIEFSSRLLASLSGTVIKAKILCSTRSATTPPPLLVSRDGARVEGK
jgi:hypothetical protein